MQIRQSDINNPTTLIDMQNETVPEWGVKVAPKKKSSVADGKKSNYQSITRSISYTVTVFTYYNFIGSCAF
ncbi:MAG: hypothetical protein LBF68_06060 [Christensenellaceae bacterium]|jgi:hypothetical protein|nr:hypothetical protein [Christensenellaceae bacterium]